MDPLGPWLGEALSNGKSQSKPEARGGPRANQQNEGLMFGMLGYQQFALLSLRAL